MKALCSLLDIEVGAGVEPAHITDIDVEQAAQPAAADRGVQLTDPVTVHSARSRCAGPAAGTERSSAAAPFTADEIVPITRVDMVTPALIARSRQRPGEGFDLEPWIVTPARRLCHCRRRSAALLSVSVAAELVDAAVDVLDHEVEAVERVQLEVAEQLTEQRDVDVESAAVVFGADFVASLVSGLNCRSCPTRRRRAVDWAADADRPLPERRNAVGEWPGTARSGRD